LRCGVWRRRIPRTGATGLDRVIGTTITEVGKQVVVKTNRAVSLNKGASMQFPPLPGGGVLTSGRASM